MIRIERTITIHRPVEEVFAYICDVEHGPRYISGQREAHRTSSGPMGIGTTFATSSKYLRRSTTCEVTEYEPNLRVAWKARSGAQAKTTWGFQPFGDRVVVKPKPKDSMTSSGLVLPDTASEKPQEGSVLSVGPGRVLDSGNRVEMDVQVGDSVLFARYAGTEVKLDGDEYLVIRE